ncbi:hypothetical protein AVEN_136068-1 [Araneus ventricosus]|uniref:Uncharacterized protein n=1 Tax=Araneus ventricosus TaxID=182803 RepID=A0A4Y2AF45_ARAVE|nr:hypothetical protein AVEN_136068-1 [Araneus ventricosus]
MSGSTDEDSTDHERDSSVPSGRKKSARVPDTTKTAQSSQPKGVGGVEAVEDLIKQIRDFHSKPDLAEFLIQKLQFLT